MKKNGNLIVISGPSGVGKSTLVKRAMAELPDLKFSVSCTTRAMRPGEVDGVHYFFITDEKFSEMIDQEAFLEYGIIIPFFLFQQHKRSKSDEPTEQRKDKGEKCRNFFL